MDMENRDPLQISAAGPFFGTSRPECRRGVALQAVQFFHGVQIECGQVGFGFRSYGNFHRLYQKDGILFPKSVLYLILTGFCAPLLPE